MERGGGTNNGVNNPDVVLIIADRRAKLRFH